MSLLKTVSLTKISVRNQGEYVKGIWTQGTPNEIPFNGTFQPAKGQVLETLPEGKRNRETYICYAPIDIDFTSADPENEYVADCIRWQGKVFEVITASKWDNGLLPHWELLCVRKKEGEK